MSASLDECVSVIIPARNEEANIERVVRSLTSQPAILEILVVDDQSEDRTPAILAHLEAEFPRVRSRRLDALPKGWVGKTYAAAHGARAARGEWLLFTDADTEHLPGSLGELLERAEREGADLLSVSPGQETPTWWEQAVIPLIYVQLSRLFRFEEVSDPRSPAAAANGQYLLVRRTMYERSGGHEAVKSEILEDVELARRIKAQGGKLVFLPGARWVRTRMYRTFRDLWRGWSKNFYLLYERNLGRLLASVARLWLLEALPLVTVILAGAWAVAGAGGVPAGVAAGGFLLVTLWRHWEYSRALSQLGFNPRLACYLACGATLVGSLLLNSARAHLVRGSVEWKGRHYETRVRG